MKPDISDIQHRASKISSQTAMVLGIMSAAAIVPAYYVSVWLPSQGILTMAVFCLATLYVSFVASVHARVERLAAEEMLGISASGKRKGELFEDSVLSSSEKVRTWEQFEKWFVPAFTLIFIFFEAGAAYYLKTRLEFAVKSPIESPRFHPELILGLGIAAFLFFLAGKYSAGLAYSGARRHLRAPAAFCLLNAFFTALIVIVFIASYFSVRNESSSFRNPDPFLLYAGIAVLIFLALDHFAGLIISFYRQKADISKTAPLYDSRIAGFFTRPEGIWESANEMLEYQFGIRLESTGTGAFFSKFILPLALFQVITLLILSCIIVVPSGKRAFREKWGGLTGAPLEPGLHFKLPWPVEKTYYTPADLVMDIQIGSKDLSKNGSEKAKNGSDKFLWSGLGEGSGLFLTPRIDENTDSGDNAIDSSEASLRKRMPIVNLIAATATVMFRISNPYDYYYRHAEPQLLLEKIAYRELIAYFAAHDGIKLISDSIGMDKTLLGKLNEYSKNLSLGIEVVSVSLDRIQPPPEKGTAMTFHQTMIEEQKSKTMVFDAESYGNKILPEAKTDAEQLLMEAESYKSGKVSSSKADSEVFMSKYLLYQKYKNLYTSILYLEKLQEALKNPQKYIIASNIEDQVISFDLKSEVTPELLDMVNPEKMEK